MSASIYYTVAYTEKYCEPPEIKFSNVSTYNDNYKVDILDYVLIRFNIIVQTGQPNNENNGVPGFSASFCGNMQIYPTTFTKTPMRLTLDNRVDLNDVFYPGRMIYCTDTILDVSPPLTPKLKIKCEKKNNNAILTFDFDKYDEDDTEDNLLIYSINIEILNTGKIPEHCITTSNFHNNKH